MANHDSTKKSIRQSVKKTKINRDRITRVRTFIKKVEAAIASGVKEEANKALSVAQSEMMRSVSKGVLKINTVSRKISRLSAKVKKMSVIAA
jgi:small subunit ribosomal protein S20